MAAGVAVATLTCCANSHPFQERRVTLAEPVKIGRSVAQSRPAQTNAIFDCKVLSRNHALLWYDGGKFFLQDTKSSNGTFVNSQRLSKGSEESTPFEVFSNDTVQFGVDVMENSLTHSCIIATIQLFHPDGREAVSSNVAISSFCNPAIRSQELCQVAQYLQEALHREQMLENKLAALQSVIASTRAASQDSWQAMVDEDRLLSRLGLLENQLNVYAKSHTEESLQRELVALHADKFSYENMAKESLRRMLEEKLEAVRKASELERALSNSEDECSNLQAMYEKAQELLQKLVDGNEEQGRELSELADKYQKAEKQHQEELEHLMKEKLAVEAKLEQLKMQEEGLHAKIESLQAESDFMHEQLNNMKVKLESGKRISTDSIRIPECNSCGVQVDLISLLDLRILQSDEKEEKDDDEESDVSQIGGEGHLHSITDGEQELSYLTMCSPDSGAKRRPTSGDESESLLDQLKNCSVQLENNHQLVVDLQQRLSASQSQNLAQAAHITSLQDELHEAKQTALSAVEQLSALKLKVTSPQALQEMLTATLHDPPLAQSQQNSADADKEDSHPSEQSAGDVEIDRKESNACDVTCTGNIDTMQQEMQREAAKNRAEFAALKDECAQLRQRIQDIENEMKKSNLENVQLKAEYSRLQESYKQLERLRDTLQNVQATCQSNLTDAQKEADRTKTELIDAQRDISHLNEKCADQQNQIEMLESELQGTLNEYSTLSFQCRTLSHCAMVPLFLLLFAILLAFYPVLATVTATTTPDT